MDAKNTAAPLSLVDGHYPSFKEIKGLSFPISIVMSATDLSLADELQRQADAERIVASWNAHDDLVSLLKEAVESGALRYLNQECCGNGVSASYAGGDVECCGDPLDLEGRARAALAKALGGHHG